VTDLEGTWVLYLNLCLDALLCECLLCRSKLRSMEHRGVKQGQALLGKKKAAAASSSSKLGDCEDGHQCNVVYIMRLVSSSVTEELYSVLRQCVCSCSNNSRHLHVISVENHMDHGLNLYKVR
jgi:hypothetical protein